MASTSDHFVLSNVLAIIERSHGWIPTTPQPCVMEPNGGRTVWVEGKVVTICKFMYAEDGWYLKQTSCFGGSMS